MIGNPTELPYTMNELRRYCRQLAQVASDVPLDHHTVHISDIHPDYQLAGMAVGEHEHSIYEGHIILQGAGVYATGRGQPISSGGALLHGPHMLHGWEATDTSCLRLLIWFTVTPAIPVTYPPQWPVWPEMLWDIHLLFHEIAQLRPGWHVRVPARLTTLFSRLFSISGWPDSPQLEVPGERQLVGIVEKFLLDNLGRPLTLLDIAAQMGMSERSLCRQYLQATGDTIMARLLHLRMERAVTLLANTSLTLAEIANQVGIEDPSYFCRRFRRHFHATPRQYRCCAAGTDAAHDPRPQP
jgi:AraC-like DNA-binding protein